LSRRTIPLAALCAALALAWAAAPAQAIDLTPPEPHSPNADAIHSSYVVMVVIALVLVVVVNAALIAAVVRFRDRRGREPARFTAGRGAFRPLVAGLSAVALAIFVFGVIKTNDARDVEPTGPEGLSAAPTAQVGVKGVSELVADDAPPLEIDAIAQQWVWRFEYPGHTPSDALFSYGELVVPVDTAVVLNVTSTDVLHSWHVPALGGQVQATPGDVVQTWFKADEVGRYEGSSTMFSGTAYPTMRSWVRVVTATEYETYIERLGAQLAHAQAVVQARSQREASTKSEAPTE
jgi:cytochrome c oxidase subunit II